MKKVEMMIALHDRREKVKTLFGETSEYRKNELKLIEKLISFVEEIDYKDIE